METVNIKIGKLWPHPKNPREDVGDVTELAESIKSQGLMQNLTVISGHYLGKQEYVTKAKLEGVSKSNAEHFYDQMPWEETFFIGGDMYTIIIGHRRFAAAKLAGLEELPCNVVELTTEEQVAMMLSENMQRNDLTVTEQAFGCQLMFDLGLTAPEIAEKTGLNKSTVYHRLNLAKLDRKVLKEKEASEEWQFSIKDLYVLEQISDIQKRNDILRKSSSSNNLRYLAENEVRAEKEAESKKILTGILEAEGIRFDEKYDKNPWVGGYRYIKEFKLGAVYDENFRTGIDPSDGTYVWRTGYSSIVVAKLEEKKEEQPKEKTDWEIRGEKKAQLNSVISKIKENMWALIVKIIEDDMKPLHEEVKSNINAILWESIIRLGAEVYVSDLAQEYGAMVIEKVGDGESQQEYEERLKKIFRKLKMTHQMWVAVAMAIDSICLVTWDVKLDREGSEQMCFLHHLLGEYGFELTKEEKQVIHGTHELYTKEKDDV